MGSMPRAFFSVFIFFVSFRFIFLVPPAFGNGTWEGIPYEGKWQGPLDWMDAPGGTQAAHLEFELFCLLLGPLSSAQRSLVGQEHARVKVQPPPQTSVQSGKEAVVVFDGISLAAMNGPPPPLLPFPPPLLGWGSWRRTHRRHRSLHGRDPPVSHRANVGRLPRRPGSLHACH